MEVIFKVSIAGPNLHFIGGKVYDLPADEANYWIREGLVEFVSAKETKEHRPLKPVVQEIDKSKTRPVSRKKK